MFQGDRGREDCRSGEAGADGDAAGGRAGGDGRRLGAGRTAQDVLQGDVDAAGDPGAEDAVAAAGSERGRTGAVGVAAEDQITDASGSGGAGRVGGASAAVTGSRR